MNNEDIMCPGYNDVTNECEHKVSAAIATDDPDYDTGCPGRLICNMGIYDEHIVEQKDS